MKATFSAIEPLRLAAEQDLRRHFEDEERLAVNNAEHVLKQQAALMESPPEWFAEHAAIEGMSVEKFRETILSKSNPVVERAARRRAAIVAIKKAETKERLEEILAESGVQPRFDNAFLIKPYSSFTAPQGEE